MVGKYNRDTSSVTATPSTVTSSSAAFGRWAFGIGRPRHDRRGRTGIVKGRSVRSGGNVLTMLSCSGAASPPSASLLRDLLQSGSDASVGQQGCAVTAHYSFRWSHCADAISRWTSSPICPSLISDRHNPRLRRDLTLAGQFDHLHGRCISPFLTRPASQAGQM